MTTLKANREIATFLDDDETETTKKPKPVVLGKQAAGQCLSRQGALRNRRADALGLARSYPRAAARMAPPTPPMSEAGARVSASRRARLRSRVMKTPRPRWRVASARTAAPPLSTN